MLNASSRFIRKIKITNSVVKNISLFLRSFNNMTFRRYTPLWLLALSVSMIHSKSVAPRFSLRAQRYHSASRFLVKLMEYRVTTTKDHADCRKTSNLGKTSNHCIKHTNKPTPFPTKKSTPVPTSQQPIPEQSHSPSNAPSEVPITLPTIQPSVSREPSTPPTGVPSKFSTSFPSNEPSISQHPTSSVRPSLVPTVSVVPSSLPNQEPSQIPSHSPTHIPSKFSTSFPSNEPSISQHPASSVRPSPVPTVSVVPSSLPSQEPSQIPSHSPTHIPSKFPTSFPSSEPSISQLPTTSVRPSPAPTVSAIPSTLPSQEPSQIPSHYPTHNPSKFPTSFPSSEPSICSACTVHSNRSCCVFANKTFGNVSTTIRNDTETFKYEIVPSDPNKSLAYFQEIIPCVQRIIGESILRLFPNECNWMGERMMQEANRSYLVGLKDLDDVVETDAVGSMKQEGCRHKDLQNETCISIIGSIILYFSNDVNINEENKREVIKEIRERINNYNGSLSDKVGIDHIKFIDKEEGNKRGLILIAVIAPTLFISLVAFSQINFRSMPQ